MMRRGRRGPVRRGRAGRTSSNSSPTSLSFESIHRCLPTDKCLTQAKESCLEKQMELHHAPDDETADLEEENKVVTLKAVTKSSIDSSYSFLFNELLHKYFIFPRPKVESEMKELVMLVCELATLCGSDSDRWKFFLLVAFHKRYHSKAPACKEEQLQQVGEGKGKNKNEESVESKVAEDGDDKTTSTTAGDGERLMYYLTLLTLYRIWHNENDTTNRTENSKETNETDLVAKSELKTAIESMIKVCTDVGGSRDANAIVEHMIFEALHRLKKVSIIDQNKDTTPKTSFGKNVLIPTIQESCLLEEDYSSKDTTSNSIALDPFLMAVVTKIAAMIDSDLELVKTKEDSGSNNNNPTSSMATFDKPTHLDFLSTVHVTLPHNGRGNKKGSSWQRYLTNCVAELFIWSKTKSLANDDRFRTAQKRLCSLMNTENAVVTMEDSDNLTAHECVLQMQTTIRKRRQILNSHARKEGHLLCSQYLMDRSSLQFRQIKAGKAGDLSMLSHLAKKFHDSKTIKMLVKRNTDPSKAQKAESIHQLINNWRDINAELEEESIEALELQLQISMVKATINALKPKNPIAVEDQRTVLVAQTGPMNTVNAVCAILLAAAIQSSTSCCLFLNGNKKDISSEDLILASINEVLVRGGDGREFHHGTVPDNDEDAAVEKLILENLEDAQDAIIVTNSDIQLNEDVLKHITQHDKTVRVHSPSRYHVKEPVEVQLKPSICEKLKSKSHPIALTVVLDCTGSMGSEIDGCKKGAIKTIQTFSSLAPVNMVNFLGYWDPIGSPGDKDPHSTGYLDVLKGGSQVKADIQTFVDTKLPCEGGGDAPEDVPAALEKVISDIEAAKDMFSSNDCVHFLFFIADAGYRPNEEERMTRLMQKLRDLDIVVIMCPVRQCAQFVGQVKNIFDPVGQYIKVANVSDISSIAAIVTESVRASLFETGTLASITSSIGENFDSLVQLTNFQKDLVRLKDVKELTSKATECDDDDDKMEEEAKKEQDDVFVSSNTYGLTNVDRMYLQMSKLPPVCHSTVDAMYGGKTFQEYIAANVASRFLDENIPVEELAKSAYPKEIVELVRSTMGGHGRKRCHDGL